MKGAGCCGICGEHCGNLWSSVFWVDKESAESLWVMSDSRSARVILVGAQYGQGMSEEQPVSFILTFIRLLTVLLVTSSSTN